MGFGSQLSYSPKGLRLRDCAQLLPKGNTVLDLMVACDCMKSTGAWLVLLGSINAAVGMQLFRRGRLKYPTGGQLTALLPSLPHTRHQESAEAEDGLSQAASSPHHRRITHTHTQTHPHQQQRSAHCASTVAATHKTPRECEAEDGLSQPASSPHHRRVTHTHTQTHPHQHRRSAHCASTLAATHKTPRECGGGGSHRLRLHSRSWFSARRGDVRCGDALRVERVILHTNCTQTVPYGYPSPAVAVCTVPSGSGPRRSFGNTHYATHYGKDWCRRRLQAQVAA